MAKEITRNGIIYKTGLTFIIKNGQIIDAEEGGEIFDHEVDSILENERATAENDAYEAELDRLDAESREPIKRKKFRKTESSNLFNLL